MQEWGKVIIAAISAACASTGFWTFLQHKSEKKDAKTQMLVGLGHDRIMFLGMHYIERGYITRDEYENLYEYLYKPYEILGGNGSAKRIMAEVDKLPIRKDKED